MPQIMSVSIRPSHSIRTSSKLTSSLALHIGVANLQLQVA